ncbi:MAG: DUF4832 domain-containing protein [Thermoguttaceae bacterium]
MKHLITPVFVLIFIITASFVYATEETDDNFVELVIKPSEAAVVNPGKGWILYGHADWHPQELVDLAMTGYERFSWGDIEPEEGVFRWEFIDDFLKTWTDRGKQCAFGVMCANTHSKNFWTTPKWVFDAGAKYSRFDLSDPKMATTGTPGEKLVPVFNDPVFMAKLEKFIEALAARYDGHPGIAFIDIRSYGNWGEGHMYPFNKDEITPKEYQEHVRIHREAFKKTLLVLPVGSKESTHFIPVFKWAIENGVSLRRDGICGNSDGSEVIVCDDKMASVFELFADYKMLRELGWWEGVKDQNGFGYTLAECVENGKPTWCDLSRGGKSGAELLADAPDLVRKLNNRLGYHFVIQNAKFPKQIKSETEFPVWLMWLNSGVAPMYVPAKVSFALLDQDKSPAAVIDATNTNLRHLKSDTPCLVKEMIRFDNIPAGRYTLAVGICKESENEPSIKLGIELPQTGNWYELGSVIVASF